MKKLSVVLATYNEENNIKQCIDSVKHITDEIIIYDESSTDKTRKIAKKNGAKVFKVKHADIFHKTKQKALQKAKGDWILQLDADERVSPQLAEEISRVINSTNQELLNYTINNSHKKELFARHLALLEKREGKYGIDKALVAAFIIPRRNYFLGKPLIHAGVYPDGVIRLVKRGYAKFPAKSVHEQIKIDGQVRWLENDLEHHDSPTFERYLTRSNRYTTLTSQEFQKSKVPLTYFHLFHYSFTKPLFVFPNLYIRHKGALDGFRGFVWSLFSALHFPLAYFKYWQTNVR